VRAKSARGRAAENREKTFKEKEDLMGNRHVIFIHGIGEQAEGYSKALWQRLQAAQIPGDVEPHEMFYYDIFQTANAKIELDQLSNRYGLNKLIESRIGDSALAGKVESKLQDVLVNTVSHVLHFCLNPDVRNAIILKLKECLLQVVMEARKQEVSLFDLNITILSHSLGTVVGYLGCHEVLLDPALGLDNGVSFKNLYSLASPLELIDWVAKKVGLSIPHITDGVKKPVRHNVAMNIDESNVNDWWSYRNQSDPVASLIPLLGDFLSNGDVDPFLFSIIHCDGVHSFSNYIEQSKSRIVANV
jgi:hypothetical protein